MRGGHVVDVNSVPVEAIEFDLSLLERYCRPRDGETAWVVPPQCERHLARRNAQRRAHDFVQSTNVRGFVSQEKELS